MDHTRQYISTFFELGKRGLSINRGPKDITCPSARFGAKICQQRMNVQHGGNLETVEALIRTESSRCFTPEKDAETYLELHRS